MDMTAPICLVFPHQLFEQHPAFAEVQTFWLIEDDLFFMRLPFHRKKLAYHRASMSYYAEKLRSKGFEVRYIEHKDAQLANIFQEIKQQTTQIQLVDPTDYLLTRRMERFAKMHQERLRKKKRPTWSGPHSILKMVLKA
jgi:deoxyribodipyrimidine photolyase-related protein